MNVWFNLVLYQATWVAAVASAGRGLWWPGLIVLAIFAALQLSLSQWRRADACLFVGVSLLGFVLDSTFVQFGIMKFEAAVPWPGLAPVWNWQRRGVELVPATGAGAADNGRHAMATIAARSAAHP